jgi:rhodanese-related sulfurtransferase
MQSLPSSLSCLKVYTYQALAILGLAFFAGLISYRVHPIAVSAAVAAGFEEVSLAQAKSLKEPLWVDARTAEDYRAGHIPGAIHLSPAVYEAGGIVLLAAHWRPGKPIVIYCDGGACRAAIEVGERLRKGLPQAHVYILKGGYPSWLSQ